MKTETLFSSVNMEWETPPELFRRLDEQYHFTLDAAATAENALCKRYFTKETDGLSQPWQTDGAVWCNPPYGRSVAKWVRKAYFESMGGQTIVMLIPARVDTAWFHDWVYHKAELRFIRGRLHYGLNGIPAKYNSAFPSMIVIYNGRDA